MTALAGSELIMMTSMGSRGDAGRLEALGFAAYLTKPVKQSQLFDCLMVVVNRQERPDPQVAPRIITRHALAERDKRRVRILLAEDNPINQRVALKTLEKLGYRAEAVGDGAEALEALARRRYDLVLMDVQMPEMDGMEATRLIRDPSSAVRDHNVPIVALTAHAMKQDRDACLAAGMNDYLSKPIKPDELVAALVRWAGRPTTPESAVGLTSRAPNVEIRAEATAVGDGRPAVFDEAILLDLLAGDREAATEITAEFLDDAPRQVAAFREQLAAAMRRAPCVRRTPSREPRPTSAPRPCGRSHTVRSRPARAALWRRPRSSPRSLTWSSSGCETSSVQRAALDESPHRRGRCDLADAAQAGARKLGLRGHRDQGRRRGLGGAAGH